jgi:hypothetical protein
VEIRRATLEDAVEMAPRMRSEDAAEVWSLSRQTPFEALSASLDLSGSQAWTVRVNGKIMAMWGIVDVSMVSGVAVPWLLTTAEVDRHPKKFLRACREAIVFLRRHYTLSMNRVDVRYGKALRWARRIGFEVESPSNDFCTITLRGA